METFEGKAFHTARWPADLELKGKRVAVIGTGATGYQIDPGAREIGRSYLRFSADAELVFRHQGISRSISPTGELAGPELSLHQEFYPIPRQLAYGAGICLEDHADRS